MTLNEVPTGGMLEKQTGNGAVKYNVQKNQILRDEYYLRQDSDENHASPHPDEIVERNFSFLHSEASRKATERCQSGGGSAGSDTVTIESISGGTPKDKTSSSSHHSSASSEEAPPRDSKSPDSSLTPSPRSSDESGSPKLRMHTNRLKKKASDTNRRTVNRSSSLCERTVTKPVTRNRSFSAKPSARYGHYSAYDLYSSDLNIYGRNHLPRPRLPSRSNSAMSCRSRSRNSSPLYARSRVLSPSHEQNLYDHIESRSIYSYSVANGDISSDSSSDSPRTRRRVMRSNSDYTRVCSPVSKQGKLYQRQRLHPVYEVARIEGENGYYSVSGTLYKDKVTSTEDTGAPLDETRHDKPERDPSQWTEGGTEQRSTSPRSQPDNKLSMLQFALLHFRDGEKYEMMRTADGSIRGSLKLIESMKKGKGKKASSEWTWREQTDMIKFSHSPIQASLLKLDTPELNKLALECFIAIMRYMGDYPMAKTQSEVDCVYALLMNCHKHQSLRDEVYCQIMKQTTNNKSTKSDSPQRGWRLFSILAAYFTCSQRLKPYLLNYLETAAYDKRRAFHGTAMVCLQNVRKTFKYGGRKNVPSIEEITAITAGRNSKRQIYRLPGGTERVINTKSTSVVQDIIEELCGVINVRNTQEMEEFSLYCIVEGDTFTMPLAREEYILDVTTELHKNQQVFYLIFCRSVWYYPLRLDNQLYIEVVFNQIAPDYLEGLLLVMPGETLQHNFVYDIAKTAALLHRAADMEHMPTMKETKYLLPKPALTVRDVKPPQWVNMVQRAWREVENLLPIQAKAQVLEILQKWSLFGSSFFAVKRVSDPRERSEHIMALNKMGVHFLDMTTHETLMHYPFAEVISTRKVKSEDGTLFLDMKVGNLMQQKITRIQTEQAHEISRLIRQYITIEQRLQTRGTNENVEGQDDQLSR